MFKLDKTDIKFTEEDIRKVKSFSNKIKVSPISFLENDYIRTNREKHQNIILGKLAEVAFQKFIKKIWDIHLPIDWEIYEENIGDDQDFIIGDKRFEIKSTQIGVRLLVEQKLILNRIERGYIPHYFVLIKTRWNEKNDRPFRYAKIFGYTSFQKLVERENFYEKGDKIPDTNTPLKADNFIIHKDNLIKDWDEVFKLIK